MKAKYLDVADFILGVSHTDTASISGPQLRFNSYWTDHCTRERLYSNIIWNLELYSQVINGVPV